MLTDTKVSAIKPPTTGQQEYPDLKVTGLRLRVGAGGKKAWIVRRRIGAKVLNRKLGSYPELGLAAARKAAETLLASLEANGSTEAIDRTFGEVAEKWIDAAKGKNSSWRLQERRLEMHVLPSWAGRKIASIRRADVRELLDGLEGEVLPNRVLTVVKTIFRFALARDYIESSPVEGIEKPRPESSRDRVLKMDEIAALWREAALLGYPFGFYLRMLLLTAQRRSEVATMKWADIDLEAATWTIPGTDTKADRANLVPLSGPALEILCAVPQLGPFVFSTDGKTHFQAFSKGKAEIDRYLGAKAEPLAQWRLHDLRRSAATHMVRLGVPELVVSRVLNHAATGVTGKVYALHSYAPEKRHALDAWAADVLRAVNGSMGGNVVALHG